jgi:hypothetical protein
VTVPAGTAGGDVVITEGPITETPPGGFSFLGQQVDITAPDGSIADPLVLTFNLHTSIAGTDPNAVDIFKTGVLVGACTGAGAMPDPCVESRVLGVPVGDNIQIVIRTSTASPWNFGVLPEPGVILQLVAGGVGLAFLNSRRMRKNQRARPTS